MKIPTIQPVQQNQGNGLQYFEQWQGVAPPQIPSRPISWGSWVNRYVGFFVLGVSLPSLFLALPPDLGIALAVIVPAGLCGLFAWMTGALHHFIPGAIAIAIVILGAVFTGAILLWGLR